MGDQSVSAGWSVLYIGTIVLVGSCVGALLIVSL